MTIQNTDEFRELVGKLCDGPLGDQDVATLNDLLQRDPISQEAFLDHLMIDALLECEFGGAKTFSAPAGGQVQVNATEGRGMQLASPAIAPYLPLKKDQPLKRVFQRWFSRKESFSAKWVMASALILSGIAMGWILPDPSFRNAQAKSIALTNAGFESSAAPELGEAVPDQWYGDKAESVEKSLGVTPLEGQRMLRFVKSATEPGNACEVYQFVDLRQVSDGVQQERLVEASAFFNSIEEGLDDGDYAFGISVYAFSEDPSDESKVWPMRWHQPLTYSGRQLPADATPQSWQRVDTRLSLPAGTQFLVVQLSVVRTNSDADAQFPGLFADNVALTLVSAE